MVLSLIRSSSIEISKACLWRQLTFTEIFFMREYISDDAFSRTFYVNSPFKYVLIIPRALTVESLLSCDKPFLRQEQTCLPFDFVTVMLEVVDILQGKQELYGKIWRHLSSLQLRVFVYFWRVGPHCATTFSFMRFLYHTQRHTTVGRPPLEEWSARRRDVWQHTTLTTDKHPCPWWDSNPQSQQASGRRPTP